LRAKIRRLHCLVLLLAVQSLAAAEAQPDQQQAVSRPRFSVGDTWTYRNLSYSRRRPNAGQTIISVASANDRAIHTLNWAPDASEPSDGFYTAEWNMVSGPAGDTYEPHSAWLAFPLQPGTSHRVAYEVQRRNDQIITPPGYSAASRLRDAHEGAANVIGWEDVTVPAGTFRALRVVVETKFVRFGAGKPSAPMAATMTLWYSPKVKRWVRLRYEERITDRQLGAPANWGVELMEYTVNPE